jgi:signal peptidase I
MEPTIHRGSLVFDETVPAAAISRGDVVTYVPPGLSRPVTHRIVSRRHLDGRLVFRTKGDNNPIADPHPFAFNERTQARYAFSIPYLGYLFIVLADPSARLWLAVIPGILLALFAVARVWRQGGELLRDQAGAGAA